MEEKAKEENKDQEELFGCLRSVLNIGDYSKDFLRSIYYCKSCSSPAKSCQISRIFQNQQESISGGGSCSGSSNSCKGIILRCSGSGGKKRRQGKQQQRCTSIGGGNSCWFVCLDCQKRMTKRKVKNHLECKIHQQNIMLAAAATVAQREKEKESTSSTNDTTDKQEEEEEEERKSLSSGDAVMKKVPDAEPLESRSPKRARTTTTAKKTTTKAAPADATEEDKRNRRRRQPKRKAANTNTNTNTNEFVSKETKSPTNGGTTTTTTTTTIDDEPINRKKGTNKNNEKAELWGKILQQSPTYLTTDGKSWYIHIKQWMPTPSQQAFDKEWDLHPTKRHTLKVYGRIAEEKRWSQSWGMNYAYSGNVNLSRPLEESTVIPHLLEKINHYSSLVLAVQEDDKGKGSSGGGDNSETESSSKKPYNGCLQNWYTPDDKIGLHSDDERSLNQEYPIWSLSWGGPRRFLFRVKTSTTKKQKMKRPTPTTKSSAVASAVGAAVVELLLEDGDLILMGGKCQVTHKHEIPKMRKKDPPTSNRINWTIRSFLSS